jgi:hypothetical protein
MTDTTDARSTLLSSNTTLFWRVFIPIFTTVFLLGLNLAFWLTPEDALYLPFPVLWLRLALLALFAGWLLFVRRTLWRLHRVEADAQYLYVSNYWTNLRYALHDVDRFETVSRLGRRVVNLWLKAPGKLGQKISFLPGSRFRSWNEQRSIGPEGS